jgi:hypothetical protein
VHVQLSSSINTMIHNSSACSRKKKDHLAAVQDKRHSDLHVFTSTSIEHEVYGQFIFNT